MSTTVLATEMASPNTMPADHPQPKARAASSAEGRGDETLDDRAGDGDTADGQEFLEMEVQAHAEHEQDDADLGQLLGQFSVGDEARGIRPDCYRRPADSRRSATSPSRCVT